MLSFGYFVNLNLRHPVFLTKTLQIPPLLSFNLMALDYSPPSILTWEKRVKILLTFDALTFLFADNFSALMDDDPRPTVVGTWQVSEMVMIVLV